MTAHNAKKKTRVCMIVQQRDVKGGIASVTNGYYGSSLEDNYEIKYVESYCDGTRLKKALKALKAYVQFRKVLIDFKPDIVHMHTSFGPSFYRMQPFLFMAVKRKIPVVNHCHGADFDEFFVHAPAAKKRFIKRIYSKFDVVIALSAEWKQKLASIVDKNRLVVISNYCKPEDPKELEKLEDFRFENRQIIFLGELGRRKGGFDFATIISNTAVKLSGVRFVLCGDGARDDVEKIRSDVQRLCKGVDVVFPGWVRGKKKDELLRQSSIFLLPSYHEGQPMSILDAMAYGLPVVSTLVGGIPKLVDDGKSGYLVHPGDTEAISERIVTLLKDKEKYVKASKESLNIAISRYGFDVHVKEISKVYDSLVK